MQIKNYYEVGTLIRAVITSKSSGLYCSVSGKIAYKDEPEPEIILLNENFQNIFSIDLNLLMEHHVSLIVEGHPLCVHMRLHPDTFITLTQVEDLTTS